MATFKITLAYDGTGFIGWQRQAVGVSVQALVEDALRPLAGSDVPIAGAGRTDAGVHALGQVASFSLERAIDTAVLVRALNARLPPEVRVLTAEEVPAAFHARFSARAKSYRYRIWNADVANPFDRRYAWHLVGRLNTDAMGHAAKLLEGEHDFTAFQTAASDATSALRRVFRSEVLRESTAMGRSAMIRYEITGNGFLRHMVRAIAGSLVEVGRGRRPPEWFGDLLVRGHRGDAGPTAPAHGLFLVSVDYGAADSV